MMKNLLNYLLLTTLVTLMVFTGCTPVTNSKRSSTKSSLSATTGTTTGSTSTTAVTIQGKADCVAQDLNGWISCKTKLEEKSIKTIALEQSIVCSALDDCALSIVGNSNVKVWSSNNSTIKRTGGFQNSLIKILSSDSVEILNLKLEETANVPLQPTPKAQEILKECPSNQCAAIISVYNSSNILLDQLSLTNGKIFGVSLADNVSVVISNSSISGAWWFGVWGSGNQNVLFSKNQIFNNRSNGILIETSKSVETKLIGNRFNGNHYATAFHVCGNGTEPCPGGQVDFVNETKNIIVDGNTFENGQILNEFPEDASHNWISGIEFEPHDGNISNMEIKNNIIRNNSGSVFYVNDPSAANKSKFSIQLSVYQNIFCNNKSNAFYASGAAWAFGIKMYNNDSSCSSQTTPAPVAGPVAVLRGSISATSCNVIRANGTCSTTVNWSAPDHGLSACVFAGTTLWACEGNSFKKIYPYITTTPTEFILRVGNSNSSPEITRTKIQGQFVKPNPLPVPVVTKYGLGCDDLNCMWLNGTNLARGMYIDIRSITNGEILKGSIPTAFEIQKDTGVFILTFRIPTELLGTFKSHGINIYVVDPEYGTWSKPIFYKRP